MISMCILFFCNLINNLVMSNSELLNRIDNELTGFTNEFDKHFPDGELHDFDREKIEQNNARIFFRMDCSDCYRFLHEIMGNKKADSNQIFNFKTRVYTLQGSLSGLSNHIEITEAVYKKLIIHLKRIFKLSDQLNANE
ncbi:conserved protein of unknown function [Oenococcus oeni]